MIILGQTPPRQVYSDAGALPKCAAREAKARLPSADLIRPKVRLNPVRRECAAPSCSSKVQRSPLLSGLLVLKGGWAPIGSLPRSLHLKGGQPEISYGRKRSPGSLGKPVGPSSTQAYGSIVHTVQYLPNYSVPFLTLRRRARAEEDGFCCPVIVHLILFTTSSLVLALVVPCLHTGTVL